MNLLYAVTVSVCRRRRRRQSTSLSSAEGKLTLVRTTKYVAIGKAGVVAGRHFAFFGGGGISYAIVCLYVCHCTLRIRSISLLLEGYDHISVHVYTFHLA